MTKADLIEEVSRIVEVTRREAEAIVETIMRTIVQALREDGKVEIRGFGSFRTRQRAGRIGRNPKTGEAVEVPPKKIAFFKPSKEVQELVNPKESEGRWATEPPRARRAVFGFKANTSPPMWQRLRFDGCSRASVAAR